MKRKSFATWPCSIARAADLLGDAWTLLILRELNYGESRFDGFVTMLGVPRNTLTDRLGRLVDRGLVERSAYQAEPVRHEYVLTEMGRDFFGVMAALNAWGDRWLADGSGAPVLMRHDPCGHDLTAQVVCSDCGDAVRPEEVTSRLGPGYPDRLRTEPAVVARFGGGVGRNRAGC